MDKVTSKIKKIVTQAAINQNAIRFEGPKLAKMTNASTTCSLGGTNVLVTLVTEKSTKSEAFVPLTVDYKQKAAAGGRIPMTHLRRDIGFTEREILTGRLIDRSIRPGFPDGFNDKTQIVCNLLAVDGQNNPDVVAINGASASLAISDIPWNGPVAAVRMGLLGNDLVTNPTRRQLENSRLDLIITANDVGKVLMLDGSCREPLPISNIAKAIKKAVDECKIINEQIKNLQASCNKPKTVYDRSHLPNEEQLEFVNNFAKDNLKEILMSYNFDKLTRGAEISVIQDKCLEAFMDKFGKDNQHANYQHQKSFMILTRQVYQEILREHGTRCDGRKFDDLRPISCEVDLYKPLHGSSLFQRGQTQVLCSTTLDSPDSAFRLDSNSILIDGLKDKNFMLHYGFPPYAVNEIGRVNTFPDRREVGHGALAEKAIKPVLPEKHELTIRLDCQVLESNGSSSMASVCAGSMSLMDASVDIKEHVAGVAMGLFSDDSNDEPIILTDIQGFEDFFGDMDFKIAGTKRAITALQLDVKLKSGVDLGLINQILSKAHPAKDKIIAKMSKAIDKPRTIKKDNHPVIKAIRIPPHQRSRFFGHGGANLKRLTSHIGVRVNFNDTSQVIQSGNQDQPEDYNVQIFAPNQEAMDEAEEFIESILKSGQHEPELDFNGIYSATIEEIRPHGVMVTLYPGMNPTLLPISQLDIRKVLHPSALDLSVGQQIQVKYFGRDPTSGQMRLSRKSLQMTSSAKDHTQIKTKE